VTPLQYLGYRVDMVDLRDEQVPEGFLGDQYAAIIVQVTSADTLAKFKLEPFITQAYEQGLKLIFFEGLGEILEGKLATRLGLSPLRTKLQGPMGILLIGPAAFFFFQDTSLLYKLLLLGCFVTVSCIWISTVFLSGLKEYVAIVGLYGLGYAVATVAAALLKGGGLEGLLTGFLIGQVVLLVGMHS
jgi:hypothetical protein